MVKTEPKVRLFSRPELDWKEIYEYLKSISTEDLKATTWYHRIGKQVEAGLMSHAEALVEFAGRLCYKSWIPELNPNVKKVRQDSTEYLENILKSKHGSVLEHANFTFLFQDVSRVFTHELVRHRAGVAISQESLRYVRLTDIGFRVPPVLAEMEDQVISIVERLEEFQREAAEKFGLDNDGLPFHYKKEVTSALRRLAPLGLSTSMIWTANIRTLRHVIEMRTAEGAEEEIKLVYQQVAEKMRTECPALFSDLVKNEKGAYLPRYSKV